MIKSNYANNILYYICLSFSVLIITGPFLLNFIITLVCIVFFISVFFLSIISVLIILCQ